MLNIINYEFIYIQKMNGMRYNVNGMNVTVTMIIMKYTMRFII